jgi:beta-phosphoglucomutase
MSEFSAKAFIFDMDGTLVDNMKVHAEAWVKLFEEIGMEMNAEDFHVKTAGKTNPEIFRNVLGPEISNERIEELSDRKEEIYRNAFRSNLQPLAGAIEFLDEARRLGVKMAVATSAPDKNIEFVLDGLNLRHYFQTVVGASDITRGKPHPEIFLKSAEQLGVGPENCLVFEDALNGVEAARRAGMQSVAIATVNPLEELINLPTVVTAAKDFVGLNAADLIANYLMLEAVVAD